MRILLRGYYQAGNTGDDGLLAVMLHYLGRWFDSAEVLISPPGDLQLPQVPLQCTAGPRAWRTPAGLLRSRAIVFGGGGILHHYGATGADLQFQLRICQMARAMRRPIAYLGVSVGPLVGAASRHTVRRILRMADVILLRDQLSVELVEEIAPGLEYSVGPDPVLLLPEVDLPHNPPLCHCHGKSLGVSIAPFFSVAHHDPEGDEQVYDAMATVLDGVLADGSVEAVKLFCLHAGAQYDYRSVRAVQNKMRYAERVRIIPYLPNPYDMFGEISSCDYFLGFRLHAAVLAYMASVPMATVDYHPKVTGFAEMIGLPEQAHLALEDLEQDSLRQLVEKLVSDQMPPARVPYEQVRSQAGAALEQAGQRLVDLLGV
ncbi:MAG: hypothetical protein GX358_08940 [candidate division WS1 bacterium]|jgi:polysaccharide pyruvyl transferase WcaK-like protein|nr:hypothetical protein [candidate division WS1 bacterium]